MTFSTYGKTDLGILDFTDYSVSCYSNRAMTRKFWKDTEGEEALVSDLLNLVI